MQHSDGRRAAGDEARRQRVAAGVVYYVSFLRENGGKSADCMAS